MGFLGFLARRKKEKPEKDSSHLTSHMVADKLLTQQTIKEIVDGFMRDEAINSRFVPDYVERSIYQNVLTLVVGIMERVVEGAEVQVLGHTITLQMRPTEGD